MPRPFSHDADGNLASDSRKGISVAYNVLGLPRTVTSGTTVLSHYEYLPYGSELSSLAGSGAGYNYRGSFVYSVDASGNERLDSVACDEGRISVTYSGSGTASYRDDWHVRDYLGNTRLVVNITSASTPASTGVLEKSDYLPFGTRVATSSTPLNRWRQSGKEEQVIGGNDLGQLDFGARHYDPWLARWTTQDPMAGKYTNLSPYSYCAGNPVNVVDLDGMDIWEIDNFGRVKNKIPDNTTDSFYIVKETSNGSFERTGQSISFDYGTIKRIDPISSAKISFSLATEKAGAELFKFFADNTSVEFGFISTQSENSWVFSDQKKNTINIIGPAIAIDKKGEIVTTTIHSHPMNSFPSGYDRDLDESDKRTVSNFEFSHHAQVNHYVYQPLQSVLILYDSKSYSKFGMPWNTLY